MRPCEIHTEYAGLSHRPVHAFPVRQDHKSSGHVASAAPQRQQQPGAGQLQAKGKGQSFFRMHFIQGHSIRCFGSTRKRPYPSWFARYVTEEQRQLQPEPLIDTVKHGIAVGARYTLAVICTDVPPLVGDRCPAVFTEKVLPRQ